jgi:hypothetical protein
MHKLHCEDDDDDDSSEIFRANIHKLVNLILYYLCFVVLRV